MTKTQRPTNTAKMSPKHVYIVTFTSYLHGEDDDPRIEYEPSVHSVHLTLKSANNAAISQAREYLQESGEEWVDIRKEITEKNGHRRVVCRLQPDSVHDTDHFVVEVGMSRVEEGLYSDDDGEDAESNDEDESDEDDESEEVDEVELLKPVEPAAKRKRT